MNLKGNFTMVPNEMLEHLYGSNLSLRQLKVMLCIIRYTYGFQRDNAELSISYIANGTHIHRTHITKALKTLADRGLILREKNRGFKPQIITLANSDISQIGNTAVSQIGNTVVSQIGNEEIKLNKDKNKDIKHPYGEYKNVLLTDEELTKLRAEIPQTDEYIGKLSAYIAGTGKKYKSHYATIRTWYRRDNPAPQPQETEAERNRRLYTVDMSKW